MKKILAFTLTLVFLVTSIAYADVEIKNTAPIAGLSGNVLLNKNINVQLLSDYTGSSSDIVTSKLNQFKSDMFAKGVNVSYNYFDGNNKVKIGTDGFPRKNVISNIKDITTANKTSPVLIPGLSNINIVDVAAGDTHSLFLDSAGNVYSCGENKAGQLGLGDTVSRSIPTKIPGLANVISIAAGKNFSAAVTSDGYCYVWGDNSFGQIGVKIGYPLNNTDTLTPQKLAWAYYSAYNDTNKREFVTGIKKVIAGEYHLIIISADHDGDYYGKYFGAINNDQTLGNTCNYYNNYSLSHASYVGLTEPHGLGINSNYGSEVIKDKNNIVTGYNHIGLLSDYYYKHVTLFGNNTYGQSGISITNPTKSTNEFLKNSSGTITNDNIKIWAGGNQTFIRKQDNSIVALGKNDFYQLGTGDNINKDTPALFTAIESSQVANFYTGEDRTFLVKNDGTLWGIGKNNYGQLGTSDTNNKATLTNVPGLTNVTNVSVGWTHTLVVAGGKVYSFGFNLNGQLGLGTNDLNNSKIQEYIFDLNHGNQSFSPGRWHNAWIKNDGTVWSVADNATLLGNGSTTNGSWDVPVQASGINNAISITCGERGTYVIDSNRDVWVWGQNSLGRLGTGDTNTVYAPVKIQLSNITQIVAVENGGLALDIDGVVWEFGYNTDGNYKPRIKTGLPKIKAISRNVAIDYSGNVWVWGSYFVPGQENTNVITPVKVSGITDAVAISSSGFVQDFLWSYWQIYVIKKDNTVWGWSGTKNINTVTIEPSKITHYPYINNVLKIQAGQLHKLSLSMDGSIYGWGIHRRSDTSGPNYSLNTESPIKYNNFSTPSKVVSINDPVNISAYGMSIASTEDNVYRWGYVVSQSETLTQYKTPTPVNINVNRDNSIYSFDFSKIKAQDNSDNYLISLSDGIGSDFIKPFGQYYSYGGLTKNFVDFLFLNNFSLYVATPSVNLNYLLPGIAQNATIQYMLNSTVGDNYYYDSSSAYAYNFMDSIFNNIKNLYNNINTPLYETPPYTLEFKDTPKSGYIAIEDTILYNKSYNDYERDSYNSNVMYAEHWKYKHDPYFENDMGVIANNDVWSNWSSAFINQKNFDKVGKYVISYQAQDNPTTDNLFSNYRQGSTGIDQLMVYVNRRPIAQFDYNINNNALTFNNTSYDLDHLSHPNGGIVQYLYKYKILGDPDWIIGTPGFINTTDTFIVQLVVKDEDGFMSLPFTKYVDATVPTITINPKSKSWINTPINVAITATDNSTTGLKNLLYYISTSPIYPIVGTTWTIKNYSSLTLTDTVNVNLNKEGQYYLHAKVTNNKGGAAYTYGGLYQLDFTPPDINTNPLDGTLMASANITISTSDNLSGVRDTWCKWATTNTIISNLTGFTKMTSNSLTAPTADGTYYLHVKSYDNATNERYMIYGPYTVSSLTLTAALTPNPAKQGQRISFNVNTTGFAKYITIYFPNEIWNLDTSTPIFKQIPEQASRSDLIYYYLPLSTPKTIDNNGNRLRAAYVIQVKAKKADGTTKIVNLNLDVKDNIYDGIRTETK